jgi:cytochrome P450
VEEIDLPALDVLGDEFGDDPVAFLRRLHEGGHTMARSHRGVELLSYQWVADLLNDDRFHTVDNKHFAAKGSPDSLLRFVDDGLLLSMPTERHDRVRRVLARAFTLRQVDAQRELMRNLASDQVDRFVGSGQADIVDDFTDRYPMQVLCRVIGVPPSDIPRFVDAAHDLHLMAAVPMAPGFDRIDDALTTLEEYVVDILERRRLHPEDDYITGLVEAQQTEGTLTRSELVGNVINLLFAGAGTTRYQLASTVRAILENDLWESVAADAQLIGPCVEEALRYYPVTQFVIRIPDDDVVIGPCLFPARRRVVLNLQAASRDPAMFSDPDRFDPGRADVARSRLPFGWGTHHCLGHSLSRAAMSEAMEVLVQRLTDVRVAGDVVNSPAGAMLGGPEHLTVTFSERVNRPQDK